jgi:two-component system, LytTR family, sensor kinase
MPPEALEMRSSDAGSLVDRFHKQAKRAELSNSSLAGFVRSRRRLWLSFVLLWIALGAFSAGTILIQLPPIRRSGPPPATGDSIVTRNIIWQLVIWLAWISIVPVGLWLKRRWPVERGALIRSLPVHLVAVLVLCVAHSIVILLTRQIIMTPGQSIDMQQASAMLIFWSARDLPFAALFYGFILGIGSAADYYQQFRERQLRASQLEAQLANAELQMLKMQLHPHFLFNTLNGITGLVRDNDNAGAIEMLVGLSDLLRQTLDNAGRQEVRLAEELEWLELYLKLQQIRFSDRLRVNVNADREALDALIPNLITQPLVENAIRHGIAPRAQPGSVSLSARRVKDNLVVSVCDDGIGLPIDWSLRSSKGVGLLNTQARLQQLYGSAFDFTVHNRTEGGVEASITIPLTFAV